MSDCQLQNEDEYKSSVVQECLPNSALVEESERQSNHVDGQSRIAPGSESVLTTIEGGGVGNQLQPSVHGKIISPEVKLPVHEELQESYDQNNFLDPFPPAQSSDVVQIVENVDSKHEDRHFVAPSLIKQPQEQDQSLVVPGPNPNNAEPRPRQEGNLQIQVDCSVY